ncbi:unnamed protein product [Somion occarium]|uniref:C2H2-type domain-containing protein n=1 Tax=Somion occarium TaxID=3059160 RepID=A0ABP1CHJ8_9APHY
MSHPPPLRKPLLHSRELVPLSLLQYSLYRNSYLHMSASPPHGQSSSPPSPKLQQQEQEQQPESSSDIPQEKPQAKSDPAPGHSCQWIDCDKVLSDPESLYNHLCNDHIGRKSTGNLCLTCKWKDCGTSCAKRDHITSHLRVHTPLKPHVCEICKKPFKRPQDLKKHEKIHTEEHHAQHRHSKAITVVDPAYSNRVHGDQIRASSISARVKPSSSLSSDELQVPIARAKSGSISLSEGSSDFGVLPTPSPDIAHSPIRYSVPEPHHHDIYNIQNQLPSWEVLRSDGTTATTTPGAGGGAKRSYDYSVGDFFTDVKKRRVNPSYDPHMVERLNTIAQSQSLSNATGRRVTVGPPSMNQSNFNPRSVSFDIRSPEELAAVNEFLITLGRDVSQAPPGARHPQSVQSHHSPHGLHNGHTPHPSHNPHNMHSQQSHAGPPPPPPGLSASAQNDYNAAAQYFDTADLTQLGLTGMPGVPSAPNAPGPGSGAGYHGDGMGLGGGNGRASHQSVQPVQSVQYGGGGNGLYPALPTESYSDYEFPPQHYHHRSSRISMSPASSSGPQSYHQPAPSHYLNTPSLLHDPHSSSSGGMNTISLGGSSPLSSHSSMSTPPIATPPHIPSLPVLPESVANFDYLRPRHAPPTIQLAPVDLGGRTMRTIVPLKTAPESVVKNRPEPMEPRLDPKAPGTYPHRGPPAKLTPDVISALSSSSSRLSMSSSSRPSTSSSSSSRPSNESSSHAGSSLYPLLTRGDDEYTLAPLKNRHLYRSPSPASEASTSTSQAMSPMRETSPSPVYDEDMRSVSSDSDSDERERRVEEDTEIDSPEGSSRSVTPEARKPLLPGIKALTSGVTPSSTSSPSSRVGYPDLSQLALSTPPSTSPVMSSRTPTATSSPTTSANGTTEVAAASASVTLGVGATEAQRLEHARLIRELLVQINLDYRQKFGTPPSLDGSDHHESMTPRAGSRSPTTAAAAATIHERTGGGSLYPLLSGEKWDEEVRRERGGWCVGKGTRDVEMLVV